MGSRPSMLLLLTDQERYDLSAPDGLDVRTPNIDRLRDEGIWFDNAYTPIGICTSARASLLTGRYPHNHGMLNNCHEEDAISRNLSRAFPTFGELLDESGYANSYAGKWHVGQDQSPADFGFRTVAGTGPSSGDDGFKRYQREFGIEPGDIELEDEIRADPDHVDQLVAAKTPIPKEATRTYFLAEKTIERLTECAESDDPFFHRTDFPGPHHPYVVPEPYASMYDPVDIEPWDNYADTFDGKPFVHRQHVHYRGVEDFDWETWAEAIAKYFGFVTFIDEQIGRILDAVDDFGLGEELVTVHGADHGDFTGSHRQFNKGPLMYQEVYHIPLVVRWPGVAEPGRSCTEFVSLFDLMPTFLDVGDVPIPDEIDARSLVPLLRGDVPDDWRTSAVAEYHGEEYGLYSQRMVRKDEYKYVYNTFDVDELYDLDADPGELNNLVDHPEYRDVLADLRVELLEWMDRTDDTIARWTQKVLRKELPTR